MTKITYLSFEVRADCAQAVAALGNVEDAADHLAGRDFPFSITPEGVDSAIRDVGRVSDAIAAGSGLVSVGADASGLDDAHSALASLRGGVQGLSQDLSGLSGLSVGVDGAGAIRGLSDEMSGLGSVLGSTASGLSDFNTAGSTFGRTSSDFSRSGAEMRQEIDSITASTDGLTASTREMVSAQSDGAQVMNAVRSGGTPGGSFGGSSGGSYGGSGGFDNSPGGSDGPPLYPPGGDGGRGGRGGPGDDDSGGSLRSVAQPLMMGGMVGAAESLMAGAGGFMAVNEAIKNTPLLAAASKVAMLDFQSGIYQAAQSATSEGVPALLHLGTTLHGLGTEVGAMGAEHMGTALGGVDLLAGKATDALKNLDPAIEDSMMGLVGLGSAVLDGIGNPATVNAIKTTSNAIADPATVAGVTNLVSSLGTLGATVATPLVDVAGTAGTLLGDFGLKGEGPAAGAGLGGFLGSKMLKGGGGAIGGAAGGFAGAGIGAIAAADQQSGVDPTAGMAGGIGGAALAKMMGLGGPAMLAMAAGGELLAHDGAIVGGGDPSGRTSTAAGGAFAAPRTPPGSSSGSVFSPDTGGLDDKGGGWRNETLLGQALDALGVSHSLSGPDGPRPDGMSFGALGREADKEFAAGQDPLGGGPKEPAANSPEAIDKKAGEAQKAYAADPTNLGLYQQAAFAKAVADARRKSKDNDDPMAAFMASGPGGGAGGGGQIVGAQGGGTWTYGGGGGGAFGGVTGVPAPDSSGAPPPAAGGAPDLGGGSGGAGGGGGLIPKGGQGLGVISGTDAATLGLGSSRAAGLSGGGGVPPGAGTPGGSSALGGGDSHPTGGWSTDNRPTLSSGWGPGGEFHAGVPGGPAQILSSLTDLRTTASNMFGAAGGLQSGPDAGALRRDWAATRGGAANQEQYGDMSRTLGSDIQRQSQAIWDKGPAAVEAYTNALADQNGLVRTPAPPVGPAPTAPSGPGEAPKSVGDLRWGGPTVTSTGPPPGWGKQGGYDFAPGTPARNPAAEVAAKEPGGFYKGPLGPGSSGPAGASQLEHLTHALSTTQGQVAQSTQGNHAMAQSLQQISKGGDQAQQSAHPMEQMNSSMQGISSGANQAAQSVGGLGDSLKGANAAASTASSGTLGAAMGGASDTGLAGFAASVGTGASAAGRVAGEATASAMAGGMAQASAKVGNEASAMGSIAANSASQALKVHSPSKVFTDIGQATGDGMAIGINASMPAAAGAVVGGMHGVIDAARGVASDSMLMVGFSFVESMLTGAEQAVKMSQFQQLGFADIGAKAKAALGSLGLMGPAGSGAQSYQLSAQEVSFANGTAANAAVTPPPQQVTVNVSLDGKPFDQKIATVVGAAFGQFADTYARQSSG